MRGGKLVGQGSYGCGFIPAIPCIGDKGRPQDTFTKLMEAEDAKVEMSMVQHLKFIDPEQKYCLYPKTICEPKAYALTAEDNVMACKKVAAMRPRTNADLKFILSTGDFALLQTPIGGEELGKIKVPKERLNEFLASLQNLFKGLYKFHQFGLYHFDIKWDNILVKEVNGKYIPRFIDFGLSRTASELVKDAEYPMNRPYEIWPYEFRLYELYDEIMNGGSALLIPMLFSGQVNPINDIEEMYLKNKYTIAQDGPPHMPSGVYFYKGEHTHDNKYYRRMFNTIIDNINAGGIEVLKKYLEKVDVFSFGLCLASVFYMRTRYISKFGKVFMVKPNDDMIPVTDLNTYNCVKGFYEVIKGMLYPNPDERYTMREALYEYQEFLKSVKNLGIGTINDDAFIEIDSPFESELAPFSSNPGSYASSTTTSSTTANSIKLNITANNTSNSVIGSLPPLNVMLNEANKRNKNNNNTNTKEESVKSLLTASNLTTPLSSELNRGFIASSNANTNNSNLRKLVKQTRRIAIPLSAESQPRYYEVQSLGSNEF